MYARAMQIATSSADIEETLSVALYIFCHLEIRCVKCTPNLTRPCFGAVSEDVRGGADYNV